MNIKLEIIPPKGPADSTLSCEQMKRIPGVFQLKDQYHVESLRFITVGLGGTFCTFTVDDEDGIEPMLDSRFQEDRFSRTRDTIHITIDDANFGL